MPQTIASQPSEPTDLQILLGDVQPRRRWQWVLLWLVAGLVALGVGGGYYWFVRQRSSAVPTYTTEEVRRGSITLSVSANGTLQPTRAVTIGSELSGTVRNVLVDVNDKVKKGQVLVELDTAKLDSQVLRSRASLASSQARLAQSVATVKEAKAGLDRLEEVARLSGGKVPSAAELDTGQATLDRARAEETSARASVDDAKAALSTDETSLSKASIRSPIDGVVLTRTVDPGNAVAASLQAVTLFTVAEDLTRLRLDVNVDEADVGSVKVGQKASFTVSAYPSRRYPATVTRVAFGSTKTDNVVTYITWLEVDNSDMSLRPGMTATAAVISTERNDVLLVPNTALRFNPLQPDSSARPAASGGGGIMSQLLPRMPRSGPRRSSKAAGDTLVNQKQVWVLKEGVAQPLTVKVGISDGRFSEVSGDGLEPGLPVITDQHALGTKP